MKIEGGRVSWRWEKREVGELKKEKSEVRLSSKEDQKLNSISRVSIIVEHNPVPGLSSVFPFITRIHPLKRALPCDNL